MPLHASDRPRPGGAHPGRLRAPATLCASAPVPPARRCPARARSRPPRRSRWRPALNATACAAGCSAGTASSRTTPGWSRRSPAPRRRTAPTSAPGPGSLAAAGTGVALRDELTGARPTSRPGRWSTPTGVWAGDLADGHACGPSRGTHLVLRGEPLPGPAGGRDRAGARRDEPLRDGAAAARRHGLRRPHRRAGRRPGRPTCRSRSEAEIGFLLDVVGGGLRPAAAPRRRGRGLRRAAARCSTRATGHTADLSREHAVLTSADGVVTVVGGKLTTYRRMAEDAVDAAVAHAGLAAGPCRTRPTAAARRRDRATLAGASSCRPGWSAGSAPTPRWCSTTAAAHRAGGRRAAGAGRARRAGHPGRAGLRA